MNQKASNNTAPQLNASSFVTAPINSIKNAVNNIKNGINGTNGKNTNGTNGKNANGTNGKNANGTNGKNANGNNANRVNNVVTNATNGITNGITNAKNGITNAVTNAANSVTNTVTNAANSVSTNAKNVFNNSLPTDITEPIANSFNASLNNTTTPMISVPIIIALGLLIILFIIVVIFRTQIAIGLELLWNKISVLFGSPTDPHPPDPNTPDSPPNTPDLPPDSLPMDMSTKADISTKGIEQIMPGKKEVFNVAQDKYTYSDAEPLCKSFGAELATYDQVKDAWQKGADWCNYGWVKGQAALYPTQESSYNKLQAGPEEQRSACGVPGVNGGYFDNPELKFGVNCYGTKPSENDTDIRSRMAQNNLTPGALEYDKKVQGYKSQKGEIPVNPFKPGGWSS